jgi:hypothetical protein
MIGSSMALWNPCAEWAKAELAGCIAMPPGMGWPIMSVA